MPTFLHASFDAPGWGGASTVAYALFERRQRDAAAVHFVNLVSDADAAMLHASLGPGFDNPRRLAAVHTVRLAAPRWRVHDDLVELVARLRPDVIVAHGFVATGLMRLAAPDVPLAFLTTGSRQVKRLLREEGVRDFEDFVRLTARGARFAVPRGDHEHAAVAASDLIVLHSPHVRLAYEHFYPAHLGKVSEHLVSVADFAYAEAAPFAALARPFAARDIDVLFAASDWRREEKNYPLVRHLAAACEGLRVHLVGYADADDAPLQRHGLVARATMFALLGRARAVVCPSRFDAAPGLLFEAAALGCNVVASPNCGNWPLCHEQLLARSPEDFVACIRRAVSVPLPSNPAPFLGGYADLVETLEAFAETR